MFNETGELYDRFYAWKNYDAEAARLRELIVAAGGPGGGTLLDVACGTGKHAQALAAHYTVEGMDLDPVLLGVARRRLPEVTLHHGDMRGFDLGRTYDVVTCLFSSIGYVRTPDGLHAAVAAMARHLAAGGALAVEPWFAPGEYRPNHVHLLTVDEPELKLVRMSHGTVEGNLSILDFEYLVGRPGGITRAHERHEMGLFTRDQTLAAFAAAGLRATFDAEGLMGRGLYIGLKTG
ncbi:MAG TPA: class I SAM-dependent methyltransferase [Longimicrobium sp.]|nr:class I SAM-dependent methyltransferase [Longimicrobium sp.]